MTDSHDTYEQLRRRLNALLRAYVHKAPLVEGQPMTEEEIVAEIRAINDALDALDSEHE
jgi:hypothetical protein